MASKQHEKEAPQLSAAQQANLDKLIKQAEQSYVSEDIAKRASAILAKSEGQDKAADPKSVSLLGGTLGNTSKDTLKLLSSKIWAGTVVSGFPDTISSVGLFSLTALWGGVKAGAAYVGKNQAGKECVWLVAFADNNALGRVIYADCGPLSKFTSTGQIDWNSIEPKLNDATFIVWASDSETGTSVYGTILGKDPGTVLVADFDG